MNTQQSPADLTSQQARVETLRKTSLFADLPQHALDDLAIKSETVILESDHELFHEGDPATALFVLTSGQVEVLDTKGQVLRTLGAGASFGEIGLITDAGRTATVRTRDRCMLVKMPRHTFQELLWADHEFALAVLDAVAQLLHQRDDDQHL
jgi:potassium-dependent mechanosensitive channel